MQTRAWLNRYETPFLLKRTILDVLIIVAAVLGGTFLLKKGEEAGASKVIQPFAALTKPADAIPIHPPAIRGRVDNFKEPIVLQPVRSWGEGPKNGFILRVSTDVKLNQPSARVLLIPPAAIPTVLEIQYTVVQDSVEMLLADHAVRDKTDGVIILVTTVGTGYNQSTFLTLDPIRRAEQRAWRTYNLALPPGTEEIHFSIIGPPPDYNVLEDSCAICLPQIRVPPTKAQVARSK